MKSKLAILLTALLSLSILAMGCSNGSDPAGTPAAQAPTGNVSEEDLSQDPVPSGDVVNIGAVLPLSGAQATTGMNLKAAMEVAEDIINNVHDIDWDIAKNAGLAGYNNAKINVIYSDCQSDASIASTEAASLLEKDVTVITGAYSSAFSASVGTMAMEYGIPMICGSSSSASLTDGTYPFGDYFNRVAANDEMETIEFFEFLDHLNEEYDAGIQTVAIAWINNAYGIHADEMFAKYAVEFGYDIVADVSYDSTITAADTEAATIKAANPDVVFQASYIGDLTLFAQAYDSLDFQPTMIMCYCGGFQDASFADVAVSYNANFYAGGQACTVVLNNQLEIFGYINDLYHDITGYDIDGPALEEFASIVVAAQAINAAGSTDPEVVRAALKTETFDAPYFTAGAIKFNELGQNEINAAFVTQLIDGLYQSVFPIDEFVTSDPVI